MVCFCTCKPLAEQVVKHILSPTARFRSTVEMVIYLCNNNADTYTNASAMRKVATMVLDIEDPFNVDPPRWYKLAVSFTFGASEFQASARDEQTGKEVKTSVVFIAD